MCIPGINYSGDKETDMVYYTLVQCMHGHYTVRLQIFNRENIREKDYFLINRNFRNKIFVNWCYFRDDSD